VFGFPTASPTSLSPLLMLAAAIEICGSLLLLVGLFTPAIAFVMSGEMAFAYFMSHAPRSFYPIVNRGEPAIRSWLIFNKLIYVRNAFQSDDQARRPT
jgi:putative oxidoreductase